MIIKRYTQKGIVRTIKVEGRKVTILTPELNFVPFEIDLDRLNKDDERFSKLNDLKKLIEEIAELNTEQEMINDVTKDFKKTGWRCVSR